MLNVVKVRIYPKDKQKQTLHKTFGSCRLVYNLLLDARIKAYECGDSLSSYDLIKRLPAMKNSEDGQFLKEVDSTALQQSIINMDKAYQKFFKENAGFPKFKSKHNTMQSYKTLNAKIKDKRLYLPKIGLLKMKGFREFEGKLKSASVSFEAGQYHASLLFDDGVDFVKPKHNGKAVGIDIGVKLFATLSSGEMIKPLDLEKDIEKMKKAQKSLSRKKKGSANRNKAKAILSKMHLKIKNKRNDFIHKLSNKITNENQVIVIEDLKIKNMTKRAVGTIANPKKSSGKRGLNRAITQQSWGEFFTMLEYKAIKKGGEVIKVNPAYTSQTCSKCGHVSKDSRKSQSKFECCSCGFKMNADLNASFNIVNAAGFTVKAS